MKTNKSTLLGMLVLAVCAIAVGLLFVNPPAETEEEEASIETVVPVHTGQIIKTTLHGYETVYGRIAAAPAGAEANAGRVAVQASIDGILARTACSPGQIVAQGDVLFELDPRMAEMAVNDQQQQLAFAQQEYERQQQLLEIEGTSQKDFQQAERNFQQAEQALATARLQLDFHTIRASIGGTVTRVLANAGDAVQASQVLGEVLDTSRRVISMQLPITAMDRIERGMPVQLETDDGWIDAGTLDYIAEAADPGSGSVELRATLSPEAAFHIGQFVRARILCETHTGCLAVPDQALVTDPEGGTYIAVIAGDRATRRPVVGKLKEGGWIEIEGEDLAEGMEIATEGAYGLPEETRIEILGR